MAEGNHEQIFESLHSNTTFGPMITKPVELVMVSLSLVSGVHGGRSWLGPDPKPPPPPLQTSKWLSRTMGFVGTGGAGDFVLGIWQGEIFLFNPVCLYSKYSEFCGEFKNG